MIEVRYKGRLGNNLFQYCLGRILAENLRMKLKCDPIPGFKHTFELVEGGVSDGPEVVLTGQIIPLRCILNDPRPPRIVLDGYFQRAEYYRPFLKEIKRWLTFDHGLKLPDRPDLFVHV